MMTDYNVFYLDYVQDENTIKVQKVFLYDKDQDSLLHSSLGWYYYFQENLLLLYDYWHSWSPEAIVALI